MARRVDARTLYDLCGHDPDGLADYQVVEAVLGLGALARWWLRDGVLARAAAALRDPARAGFWGTRPALPATRGGCWAVFANENPGELRLLRDAFLLPLRWQADAEYSPLLPPELAAVARQVEGKLRAERVSGLAGRRWGLRLACEGDHDARDLSGLPLPAASAAAALAAGLVVAAGGGKPDPTVCGSGVWSDAGGVGDVDHLKAKLRAAADFGVRRFFVPQGMAGAARGAVAGWTEGVEIGALTQNETRLTAAAARYAAALFARPGLADPFDTRRDYYRTQWLVDRDGARSAYLDLLLADVARQCRAEALGQAGFAGVDHLVTIVSYNWEQVPQGLRVFRPRRCLLLYTADLADECQEVLGRLAPGPHAEPPDGLDLPVRLPPTFPGEEETTCLLSVRSFRGGEDMAADLDAQVRRFAGPRQARLLFDLTPGTKEMSIELITAVAGPHDLLTYARHKTEEGNFVVPGSQRYVERRPAGPGRRP